MVSLRVWLEEGTETWMAMGDIVLAGNELGEDDGGETDDGEGSSGIESSGIISSAAVKTNGKKNLPGIAASKA